MAPQPAVRKLLFNIYIIDLPRTQVEKCGYVDYFELAVHRKEVVQIPLKSGMKKISSYLQRRSSKLSAAQVTTTASISTTEKQTDSLMVKWTIFIGVHKPPYHSFR